MTTNSNNEVINHDRRRLLGTAAIGIASLSASSLLSSGTSAVAAEASETVRPFRIDIPEEQIADLRRRIAATRWPDKETVADDSQGVQLKTIQQLAQYWYAHHDWRKVEARLNSLPQFVTEIDGLDIHFIHVRSKHSNALPVIVTHGWPGSIIEQMKIIEPLTNPTAHGGTAADAFDLVIPSLPGHGFSGKPTEPGWTPVRIARAWTTLMRRLGYKQFVAQGGDWGNAVSETMALQEPVGLLGIHTNMPATVPPAVSRALSFNQAPPADLTGEEKRAWDQLDFFYKNGLGYAIEMSNRPQTLYGLVDSPIGLAAWMLDHDALSEEMITRVFDGQKEGLSRDDILDNITLYWLTNTAVSSARLYWDTHRVSTAGFFDIRGVKIPVAVSAFPDEIYTAPHSWSREAYSTLIHYNRMSKGGHFAAWEQPELFVAEMRTSFRSLRNASQFNRRREKISPPFHTCSVMNRISAFCARHAALAFALRTFAAAMLAFSLALLLEMPRPYWAMASVYITSNQLVGATWSKAVYRMLGTLIGAAGTILLIPNLVNAPELLSAAIALWVGVFLYLSLIDGTPRSYIFMLAGYTVALLGFPILSTPQLAFDIVSARVQEILLGMICASVFSILVLPRTVAATIATQADAWLDGARRLAIDTLTRRDNNQERDSQRMRLAASASEIDQLSRHLGYEVSTSANIARGLQRLQQHMLWLLPLLAAIEDRQAGIAAHAEASARMAALSARVADWLVNGGQAGDEATELRSSLDKEHSQLDTDATWVNAMTAAYALRLLNLMDITLDCQLLRNAIANGGDPDFLPLAFIPDTWTASVQHRDYGLALWSAATATFSILACCTFWIATGWSDGASAAIFAAVLGSLFAGIDDPLPAYRNFYKIIFLVIAVNGIYMFGILPRITTLEMLIAALMPTFVLFGWMSARPATARAGSFLAIFTSVQLALSSSYTGDFASFANGSVSLFLGVVLTAIVSGVIRLSVAEWVAERLLSSNWKTLATVTEGRTWQQGVAIASLMQHRLALLASRIAVVPAEARSNAAHLRQLRTALNIMDLRRANPDLSYHARRMVDALLDHLGSVFRTQTAGRLSIELVGPLDDTIAITLQEAPSPARDEALIALTGMRFGLFPETPEYEPHKPHDRRLVA